jgi:diguanylate cyclase (GGDEF)-like protein
MYPMYGLVATVAILVAVERHRPARRGAWRLVAAGLALLSVGDLTYSTVYFGVLEVPYPSLADFAYLAGYAALVTGSVMLVRGRSKGGDRTPLIDAAILAAGAASLFWVGIMAPNISGATDPLAIFVSLAYPFMDLMLLTVGLRALLGGGAPPRYLQLLLAGMSIYFVADIVYAVALLDGTYVSGHPVDLGWIVGVLLMAVAGLHPSVSAPVVPVAASDTHLSRSRLALLATAAMLAPGILLFQATAAQELLIGLVVSWTILFGLVLIRLAATVDELGVSLLHRRRLQDDLAHQATHDPLTRLANRTLFETRLAAALAADASSTALIFLDLDDFKAINDTLGHSIGDELLQTVAARIQRELRADGLAARLGGDEFAILIEHCPDEASARSVAERVLSAIRAPLALGGRRLTARASAGIALGRKASTGIDLMRDADVAMYQAKSHGKDQVELHEPAMHESIVRGYELRTELASAIASGDFVLEYQPGIEIEPGKIIGAEALVRWRHPERGIVGPLEFIPIAESSGLIHRLGAWILREACTTAAGWPTAPDGEGLLVSVNLAPTQLLQPHIVDEVAEVLRDTGLDPSRLVLEVTESALTDLEAARKSLLGLKDLGVLLALDDFGTGYSALSYLADLPFDIVKIDRSFVVAMEEPRIEALLDGILGLCSSLGLWSIAEGIETEAQLERLRRLGCQYGQGYFFARPMPAPAFEALLRRGTIASPSPRERPIPHRKLASAG